MDFDFYGHYEVIHICPSILIVEADLCFCDLVDGRDVQ